MLLFLSVTQDQTNLYGSHPFYLAMEEGGTAHGFFLLNSNAMGQSASQPDASTSGFALCVRIQGLQKWSRLFLNAKIKQGYKNR